MPAAPMNPAVVTCQSCRRELAPSALFCPGCGSPRVKESADVLLGKVLGDRFLILERLGHGTSGTLYRGEHVTLRRKVAIKVLHDELSRDDLAVERFRREATSVAELDNEHIVEIHDFGRTPDNRLYLAMELLEGETLDQTLAREGRLDVERAVDVLTQVGDALAFAHSVGFVHRDLRPRNLFLSVRRGKANFVKLLDFGLSKLVETGGAAASTSLGMTFGDPRYMSPEQAKGDAIDRRADIYSLGCIGYEMLTGAPPFVGHKVFEVLSRHVSHPPMALREHRADVPHWLQAAIMRMLSKAPDDRFLTAARMVEALQLGLRTGETFVEPPPEAVPTEAGSAASSSRRGPTGTPAVGVPAVVVAPAAAAVPAAAVSAGWSEAVPAAREPSAPIAAAPAPPTPSPTPAAPTDPEAEPTVATDPAFDAEAARAHATRRASSVDPAQSANLSGAWFDEEAANSVARARRTIHPGDSLFGEDEYAPERRRWVKPALIGGGIGAALLLVLLLTGGGGDGEARGAGVQAAVLVDAGVPAIDAPPPPPPLDAAVAAVVPERRPTPPSRSGPATERPRIVKVPTYLPTPTPSMPAGTDRQSELDRRLAELGIHPDESENDGPGPTAPPPGDEGAKMAEIYAKAGDAALRSGDPIGAAGNYNKALAANASNLDALIGLGEVALQQGQYTGAIGYLKKAARLASRSPRINTLLGEAYLNSGNATAAEAAFKKALQADPDNDRARNGYNEAVGRMPPVQDEPDAP